MPANNLETHVCSPLSEGERKLPLTPVLFVGGAFLAGVCLMALVNRAELGLIVSQFGALWSITQNRLEIIRLCFKIFFTGVVFAAIGFACYLGMSIFRGDEEEQEDLAAAETLPPPVPATIHSKIAASVTERAVPSRASAPAGQAVEVPHAPPPQASTPPATNAAPPVSAVEPAGTIYGDTVVVPETLLERELQEEQSSPIYITITLLKSVTMTLRIPGCPKVYPIKLDDINGKALQLIAYIAWRQGKKVNLGDMRNEIFGSDDLDTNQVQESLNTAKREIRRRISQAVEQARSELGDNALPADLDVFGLAKKKYWLPAHCRVTDLAVLEEQHRVITQAENDNRLIHSVPEDVYTACMTLIRAYTGDFLEELLVEDPFTFDPPNESWAREPFTLFRDYYLDAILYAAEYERKMGDNARAPQEQRERYAEAARLFGLGAMAACNKRVFDGMFDTKVFFSNKPSRRHGAHVLLSEQLIRRAIVLYGKIGNTIVAKRVYATYEQQMHFVSNKVWSADSQTLKDLEAALQQTGAYRFPDQIASPYDLSSNLVGAESA